MSQMADFFKSIQLPTMPEVAHELIGTLNDDDAPVSVVRNSIAKDPALTAKLLRLANSARFGVPRSISSIDDAITMGGMGNVRTLALSACLSDAFPDTVADPLAARPFSRLGGVLHVADVMSALQVDTDWVRRRMPHYSAMVGETIH
jgi:HD-like signal output (HDOD) protein